MHLPRLSMLQIGDVHWPEFVQPVEANQTDPDFSSALVQRTAAAPSAVISSKLSELFPAQGVILLMGDLTLKGSIEGYEAFLDHFKSIAEDSQLSKVLVTPGNHDLDQRLERDDGSYIKFDAFQNALATRGIELMPTSEPIVRPLSLGSCSVLVLALNSCRGCGVPSKHNPLDIPEVDELLQSLAAELERLRAEGEGRVWERFDTPAFDLKHLDKAISAVRAEPTSLPVLAAHHNLLPQTVERVRPYGELLNAGLTRSRLMATGRTLLYLHGHIHDDPVEVLTGPDGTDGRVVLISAPKLHRGFNEIEVEFSQDGGALGCIVKEWRYERGSMVALETRVSLRRGGLASLEAVTDGARALYDDLPPRTAFRVVDIQSTRSLEEKCGFLLELEWFGLVRLFDKNHKPQYWRGSTAAT